MFIIRSAFSQWFSTIYVALISIVLVFLLGRFLGPNQFGIYSYIQSIVSICFIFQEGGFRTLMFRESTSKTKNFDGDLVNVFRKAIGHVIVASTLGILIVTIFPIPYGSAIATAMIYYGFIAISGFVSAKLKGDGKFEKESIWQIVVRTLTFGCIIGGLYAGIRKISLLYLCLSIGILLAMTLPYPRKLLHKPLFKLDKQIFRTNVAFLTINIATVFYFRCDIILLERIGKNLTEVGEYAAAYRLLEGIILVITPIAHIGFRYLRLFCFDKNKFNRLFWQLFAGMLAIGIFVFIIGTNVGSGIVQFAFGNEFKQTDELLFLLLFALIFALPNYIVTQAMIALNKEKNYAYAAIAAAVLNIAGNIWLIPEFGAKAAAFTTIATEAFLLIYLSGVYFKW
jgi:O-antigen/teichoic acid export membrane protein